MGVVVWGRQFVDNDNKEKDNKDNNNDKNSNKDNDNEAAGKGRGRGREMDGLGSSLLGEAAFGTSEEKLTRHGEGEDEQQRQKPVKEEC